MKFVIMILAIVLLEVTLASGEWRTYTTSDGLAGNLVRGLATDGKGGIWAACRFSGGMSYFNGSTWQSWTKSNSAIPDDDPITTVVDHNGIVWAGTGLNHLMSFDGVEWKMHIDSPIQIHNIVVDRNNVKWMATYTHGLARYDDATFTVYTTEDSELRNNIPIGLAVDMNNAVWVGYWQRLGVTKILEDVWTYYEPSDIQPFNSIYGIGVDRNNSIWMASDDQDDGIWRLDEDGTTEYFPAEFLVNSVCHDIKIDHDNVVWIATAGGVTSFDGTNWNHYTTENSGLLSNFVVNIVVDENNVKWFATYEGGVSSFDYQLGPHVILINPKGGDILEAGSVFDITWYAQEIEHVSIDFSADGGQTWSVIASSIDASSEHYTWQVTDITSDVCMVKITDFDNPQHADTTYYTFTVSPPFVRIIAPNGGEEWAAGTKHEITWEGVGVESLSLEYSLDGGESWTEITDAVDFALKSFTWTLPQILTSLCLVRATDTLNSTITDKSDLTFRIVPQVLTLIYPNGGESLFANNMYSIRWDADGVNKVTIEYSVDGGLSWNLIRRNVPASDKSYQWRPKEVESTLCILRITDAENEVLFDDSDGTFIIHVLVNVDETDALEFRVYQNSPNPFNASTTISFTIPEGDKVTVEIFNMSGQKVATLVDGYLDVGRHTVTWDASRYSAGLYFYRILAGDYVHTEKMLFVK